MTKPVEIAVVGATGLIGGAVIERLADADLTIGKLYPLASDDSDGEIVSFGQRNLTVHSLAHFDFSQVQLVILCVPVAVVVEYLPRIQKEGCWVIDHSTFLRQRADVPLVTALVNPGDIALAQANKLIACPDSAANMLSPLLHMLNEKNQVQRANVTVLRAVSDIGKSGIDELSKQSIALFNLKPIVREKFSQQIAFNVIPYVTECSGQEYDLEQQIEMELRKICHDNGLKVHTTMAYVSVFYGHSIAIQLELRDRFDLGGIQDSIKNSSTLVSVPDAEENELPTPVTHGANQEGLFVGRLHKDPSHERGLGMWLVADNVHQAVAINSVQITEILVKDYL